MPLPLLKIGPDEPDWVRRELFRHGRNPQGKNVYRLVWSQNKVMLLNDDVLPEYDYDPPRWVLEKWLDPVSFIGSEIMYEMTAKPLGPYPREGYWCEVIEMPPGLPLSADVLSRIATLIERGRASTMTERMNALKEREAKKKEAEHTKLAESNQDILTSAAKGLITQPASGRPNVLRTPDDWERDQQGSVTSKDLPFMPQKGGLTQY